MPDALPRALQVNLKKVEHALTLVNEMRSGSFPHTNSKDALDELQKHFEKLRRRLGKPYQIQLNCRLAVQSLEKLLPVLGFVLRSTNTRNSFEVYEPLSFLCQKVSVGEIKLLISSEWDYSPYVYPSTISELDEFVLIGLPVMESANSLVIPAAGHELGHLVWKQQKVASDLKRLIGEGIHSQIRKSSGEFQRHFPGADIDTLQDPQGHKLTGESHDWCLHQCEELFCDFVGLWLFGKSYLYVFEYLLAPNLGGRRTEIYPTITSRAEYLADFAGDIGVQIPNGFADSFEEESSWSEGRRSYLLELADKTRETLIPALQNRCRDFMQSRVLPPIAPEEQLRAHAAFGKGLPVCKLTGIAPAVNAAWEGLLQEDFLVDAGVRKEAVLNELLLKTFEIMEYELRVGGGE